MRAADSMLVFKAYYVATKAAATFSTRLAGALAYKLWFTPWRVPVGERGRARQGEWLSRTKPVQFTSTYGRIAGFEAGSGPAVLLAHGWGERAASLGAFIEPLTNAGYRVVGIDFPGHGDSDHAEPNLYVVSDVIREVAQQVGNVTSIVAHSMGGHGTMFALKQGFEIDSAVLLAPNSRLGQALVRFVELLSLPPRAASGLKAALERKFGPDLWTAFDGSELVADVAVPALIVHDKDDPQVPLSDTELVVDAWQGARLITTESLGHGRILRDEKVLAEVVAFVERSRQSMDEELQDAAR